MFPCAVISFIIFNSSLSRLWFWESYCSFMYWLDSLLISLCPLFQTPFTFKANPGSLPSQFGLFWNQILLGLFISRYPLRFKQEPPFQELWLQIPQIISLPQVVEQSNSGANDWKVETSFSADLQWKINPSKLLKKAIKTYKIR